MRSSSGTTSDVLDTPNAGGMLIRGSALRAGGHVAIILLGLLSAPLLPRYLGIVSFGQYSQVIALIAIVGLVTEAGISSVVIRELSTLGVEERAQLMRNVLGLRLALTLAGIAVAVAVAALAGYGATLVLGTVVAGAGLIVYTVQTSFVLPLAAELRFGWATASDVLRQAVFVLLVVAAVVAGTGLQPIFAAPLGASLVGTMVVLYRVRGTVPYLPAFDLGAWRSLLGQTQPIAVAGALYSIYFRVMLLLLSFLAAEVETGYYALSFRVLEVLVGVPFILVASALPLITRAARDDQERLRYAFGRIWETAAIGGTLMAILTFLGAPLAIAFLAGRAEPVAVDVLRIQALALLAVFLNTTYGTVMVALRMHRELIVVNGLVLLETVVAALVLVPQYGAKGAAIAATIGECSLGVVYVLALARARPDLRPRLTLVPRLVGAAALALTAALLIRVPLLPNVASTAIGGVVFLLLLACMRALPPEISQALLRRRRHGA